MAITKRSAVLFSFGSLHRLIGLALSAVILAILILFGLQFPHSAKIDDTWLVLRLHQYSDPFLGAAAEYVAMVWQGVVWPSPKTSLLPLAVAVAVWLVKILIDSVLLRVRRLLARLLPAPKLAAATEMGDGIEFGAAGGEMVSAESAQARAELLKKYREIERALKSAKRKKCTFLSMDVVGSTQMKVGEQKTSIDATFQAYEDLLKRTFKEYAAWKEAWTPDGVMICFLQADLAVGAGQRILQSLKNFNEADNKLRTQFRVRCGLNEGEVNIYEDSDLAKVADRIIDVAGHMQKHAAPDTLWLSAEVYESLSEKAGFRATDQEVDGFKVYEWTVASHQEAAQAAS